MVTYSEDFSNISWSKFRVSVTPNTTISPIGILNAYSLIEDSVNSTHVLRKSFTSSNTGYSFSFFVKSKSGDRYVELDLGFTSSKSVFDIENGTIISDTTNNAKITSLDDNWYKISISDTVALGENSYDIRLVDKLSGSDAYLGNGASGIYIYGAQLEEQSYSTSYIPTSGASATRNQELCNDATPVINSEEGTLYAEISALDLFHGYISISDGTYGNSIRIGFVSDTLIKVWVYVGNSQVISQLFTYDTSNMNKIAVKYSLTDFKVYINGSNVFSTSSITFPIGTLNKLAFRRGDQYSPFFGNTKDLKYYPKALADVQLKDLTTI